MTEERPSTPLARVVIGAPASGQGKTTVATGLMAALSRAPYGLDVAAFKVGPDYIDPGYHALATGRPGRNLDPWMQGEERIVPLLLHGALHTTAQQPNPARIAIIEGVMGLFDGKAETEGFASTAHVVELTESPVILTVDISHASRTIAATVGGVAAFEEGVKVEGIILNKAGSPRHADEVKRALRRLGIPVLGVLPRDEAIHVPSRHLGLVPAAERDESRQALDALAQRIADNVDLARVVKIAMTAPRLSARPWDPAAEVHPPVAETTTRPRIAIAGGRAFTFRYAETTELMEAAGCEPVEFDPLRDPALPPDTAGIYLGGGFPEVHAEELSANASMIASIREAIDAGTPTVGECAGLLYLCREVDGHPMVGAVDATAAMGPTLVLGYRDADGTRGHEFHRTTTTPAEPTMAPNVHASYLHVHWAGAPELAQEFCDATHAYASSRPDLKHHGDTEVGEGLVDLAVNVRLPGPPAWMTEAIMATLPGLGAYPDATAARAAIAAFHGVTPEMVLPTSGGAEAFTLIARAIPGDRPVVVHPQFTEPEAALLAAGRTPHRHVLAPPFTLDVDALPPTDLLMIGNPTNPTSVLHDGEALRDLAGPGRIVVIDEAFMDAVPGEHESQIHAEMDHLLVVRSLTKTWGLAGLRAGYVVGDPRLIARLAAQQPPWSVSSPALAAMVACTTDRARVEAQLAVVRTTRDRDHLIESLTTLGWDVVTPAAGPFVLADSHDPGTRARLRVRGFAVRRGDTFPGLGPHWIRIAVREPSVTDALVEAARV
nr:cobyrinate a,c-diamide synthase [Raineyella fluvialis]